MPNPRASIRPHAWILARSKPTRIILTRAKSSAGGIFHRQIRAVLPIRDVDEGKPESIAGKPPPTGATCSRPPAVAASPGASASRCCTISFANIWHTPTHTAPAPGPTKVIRRPGDGFGFAIHVHHFPHCNPMSLHIRLTSPVESRKPMPGNSSSSAFSSV